MTDLEKQVPLASSVVAPLHKDSRKDGFDPVLEETESIQEAIEVGSNLEPEPTSEKERAGPPQVPLTRVKTAQDWNGPDDPENPQNWSLFKRAYHTAATAALGFAVTCGSSLITASTPEIQQTFGVSRTAAILPLSLFVLGLALGPVIAAPISETWGRSVVYKASSIGFLFFILGSGFCTSFGGLLVCRLLAGTVGGPCLAVGAGTNADLYPPHTRAIASTMFVMMPFLGPSLGPVVGGFAAEFKGWRWTQWCTIFIGLAAAIFCMPMSETYKKVILKRRAKKLGIEGPPGPPVTGLGYVKLLVTITLIRPLNMLFTEPIVYLLSLYNAFTFSIMFGFFAAYPYVFDSVYGFSTYQYGLTFIGIGIGVLLAVATAITVDRKFYFPRYKAALKNGQTMLPPEYRLLTAQIGCFGIPISLFWFAWTARSDVHWIVPALAGIPFGWGNLCIFVGAALYLIDNYGPLNGASAMAANGLARYALGAAFPLFTFQMYENLGIGRATSLLAFISVAMTPIPFVLQRYGPRIRAASQYTPVKA